MASQFLGLQISKTGLYAFQTAINTTAHNISNAETEGYSRQKVLKQAGNALRANASYGMIGTGVQVTSIERVHNTYYDTKYWTNHASYGEHNAKYDYMGQVEDYFSEVSTEGVTKEFTNFFNELTTLATDPNDDTKKVSAMSYAQSLTDYYNQLSKSLETIQTNANDEIRTDVNRINAIARQLSSVNQQIRSVEVTGEKANDLRDQRGVLIDELSQFVNVTVKENDVYVSGVTNSDGTPMKSGITTCAIYIDNQLLVDDTICNQLECVPREHKINESDADGLYDIYWNGNMELEFDLGSSSLTGALKGLYDIRDGNNNTTLSGKVGAFPLDENNPDVLKPVPAGATDIVIPASPEYKNMMTVDLPHKGQITIDNVVYNYEGFDMQTDAQGNVKNYIFHNLKPDGSNGAVGLKKSTTGSSYAIVGEKVNYKGIVYYQNQLNEFVRTFAKEFNLLHNQASDRDGNPGVDLFTAINKESGKDFALEEDLANQTISSSDASYYRINAKNFTVNSVIKDNASKFMTSTYDEMMQGVELHHAVLDKMIKLKDNSKVFEEGTPAQFMQSILTNIAVHTSSAKTFSENMTDVLRTITNQKLSDSGVDTNEEQANLMKFQNGYNLSAKVMSVMDEIYDKLINGTGV